MNQLLAILVLSACAFVAGAEPVALKAPLKATPVDIENVRLLDGPFRDAQQLDRTYLLKLEPDRLLHVFRANVGLPSSAKPYGGWEGPGCEVRGHCVGHYLTACALMYAATGDAVMKERVDYLVAELAKCQSADAAKGFNPGYLSAFPESFIDRVESAKPVWAPWYTLHKIMAGLLDAYEHCHNQQALDVLVKEAAWVKFRVDRLTPEQMQRSLDNEHGGMNELLANLYAVTGNPDHLRMARAFDHRRMLDPLARFEDRLSGNHANTQIPKIIGAAREYELTGDVRDRDIAGFFWQEVALKRSYVIGGHSDSEFFFPIEQFPEHLTPYTAETCNTYNMLKLTRHLFAWNPDVTYMDFYERALYNHILAAQDPKEGMFVYLMSLKPGHFKTYSTPEDSFWCCVGTGMENPARYSEAIYARGQDALYVNLFIASEVKLDGLSVRQETAFPEGDTSRLLFKCAQPVKMALKIRYPRWVSGAMSLSVNGTPCEISGAPGSYVSVDRAWRDGDRVEIRTPMTLHTEELPVDPNQVALLYGPIVLAGELGTNGMPSSYARNQNDLANVPSPSVPAFIGNVRDVLGHIEPVSGKPLTFQTRGLGNPKDVSLVPFYKLHHQRHAVYWHLYSQAGWEAHKVVLAEAEARRQALEARTIDFLAVGEPQPETDHAWKGEHTESGEHAGRHWRHATDGGWFSYSLKVDAQQPMQLSCTYWGGDSGLREFDILLDDQKIASQILNNNKPGEFFDQEYEIPAALTHGKDHVTVKFQAHPGNTAGGVFGCKTLTK